MALRPATAEISAVLGVTARLSPHSIPIVTSRTATARTATALTKRRAVDFCHVATAICPRVLLPLSAVLAGAAHCSRRPNAREAAW
jgi:hypothetical protein